MENSDEIRPIKKLKLDDSRKVSGSRVGDRLSALPNEILCYMLSFLNVRDCVRTRVLSARWRYLFDYRSVLHFDALSVLGSEAAFRNSNQFKFVSAVDKFLNVWKSPELSSLKVQFCLGNKQASHIDRWVESGIRMKIEDLELDFSSQTELDNTYVLSDQLFHSEEAIYLKSLRLINCGLTFSSKWTNWIRDLATLELSFVRLHEEDLRRVLCGGLNLTSLRLQCCSNSDLSFINVELPHLKKLYLDGTILELELNCPNLEKFICAGRVKSFKFAHVPLLREVNIFLPYHPLGCSLICDGLARHAPKLQALSLYVTTEGTPLPAYSTMSCLKRLDLLIRVPIGFDLFTIIYLLKASPGLETLHLQLGLRHHTKQSPQREYSDFSLLMLKEVQIKGFETWWNATELAHYLLKNAVALQRMVILSECLTSSSIEKLATTLLRGIKTSAELIIEGVIYNKT